ncbi:MAG: hypothetical protein QXM31_04195 [Candidatus Woesearchaeota archaeon]
MSLQASSARFLVFLVIALFIFGCQKSPTGGVVITQEDTGPKEVVVVSAPVPEPEPAPSQPQEIPINRIPTNVLPREEPQVIIIPENRPAEDPVADCIKKCESACMISADFACSKPSGADCKSACGQIIDPSACSTACSLRSAGICEPKFLEFCSAQCVGKCH